jgi:hypothetical protein
MQDLNDVIAWHFFYFSPNGDKEKKTLGIGKLGFGHGLGFFLMIGKNFKQNICCTHKP